MATYKVRDPQGNIREISGPEGASDADIIAQAKRLFGGESEARQPMQQIEPQGLGDPTAGMSDLQKFGTGMGKAFVDLGRGAAQLVGMGPSAQEIEETRKLEKPLMESGYATAGNIAGNVAAAVPATFIPGANSLVGATALGGALSALQPVGEEESRVKNSALAAALGAGGFGAGKALGSVVGKAGQKVAGIEAKVAEKAAQQAAAETASARSAAGNAAQNAYRQLEHLRELGALRGLSAEEAQIAKELSRELAKKAQEKLIPAAALKKSAAQAYQEALSSETSRASSLAAEKLSGNEVKRQIMARLLRYGPAAAGGIAGNMLFPGLGGAVGGAATGLVLRPAMRSMINLSKNPAVQRAMLSPIANATSLQGKNVPLAAALLAAGSTPAD